MSSVGTKEETAKHLIAHGQTMHAAGNQADAVQLYNAAIILDPNNPISLKVRGDHFLVNEMRVEAIADYDRALSLRPRFLLALYNRAIAKKALGRLDEALVDLDAALALDGDLFHAYAIRGDILIEFGRLDEAQADYDRAAAIDPSSSDALYRQGKAALFRKRGTDDRQAIFEYVYKTGVWGRSGDPSDRYFSGTGTRIAAHSDKYVEALGEFLRQFTPKLNAVDIGCGDFFIGSKVRDFCGAYVACDVVSGLIEHNKSKLSHLDVDFRVLDAVKDELPGGDVVFIREVLQHLSNSDISAIMSKVQKTYRYAVITECLPSSGSFVANLDKVTSDKIRLNVNGSGVVLTEAPFNLTPKDERQLCVVSTGRTQIVTTLYGF
jgi:lipoprotein NlpI